MKVFVLIDDTEVGEEAVIDVCVAKDEQDALQKFADQSNDGTTVAEIEAQGVIAKEFDVFV